MHPQGMRYIFYSKDVMLQCCLCYNLLLDCVGNMGNKRDYTGENMQNDCEVSDV